MNPGPQRVEDLLEHIVHAIDRINKYTKSGEAEFFDNEMEQDAVIRNLEIVGEASISARLAEPVERQQYFEGLTYDH